MSNGQKKRTTRKKKPSRAARQAPVAPMHAGAVEIGIAHHEDGTAATDALQTVANGFERDAVEGLTTHAPTPDVAANVTDRICELEERLDRMIDDSARRSLGSDSGARGSLFPIPPSSSRSLGATTHVGENPSVLDTARELLSSEFYMRTWGRIGMRNRSEEVDDFGFDPVYEEKVLPFFRFLYEKYFRVECEGASRIPKGRCLLVSNHSGAIPYDGLMMKLAVKRSHPDQRDVRWLAEDSIFHFPFIGSFTNRIGAVRACQENAERLLRQESLVAVFPEGVKGIGKLWKERYRLQRFGRGGFIKLCLRTSTPIVPVAIVGAEETNPMLGKLEGFTKALGVPYIPLTPTFPLLGPIGLLPAPTKWKVIFGEVISFDDFGPEAANDEILINRLSDRVRATIQAMLDRAVGERRSVWFG
jgi:1-acyl-sn-glycerol-3-phosphate acyltransferase